MAPKRVALFCEGQETLDPKWHRVMEGLSAKVPGVEFVLVERDSIAHPDKSQSEAQRGLDRRSNPEREKWSFQATALHSQFVRSSEYQQIRYVALKLMNRGDFTGTWRLLDRETAFSQILGSVFEVLHQTQPDLLVFDVTPHDYVEYTLLSAAEWLGIRVLFFQPSPIAPVMIARTSLGRVTVVESASVANSGFSDYIDEVVATRLARLQEGVDPRYMEVQKSRDKNVSRARHRLLVIRAVFLWLFRERFPSSIDFSGHGFRHGLIARASKIFLHRSLILTLRKRIMNLGQRDRIPDSYSVFALHYEPERTSLPDGLPIDFQGDAIIAARAFLPQGISLLVKEHYSQQSSALRGFLGRSPDFYNFVESLPDTQMISTSIQLTQLISGARCVFTLTGTIALEAVLRGIPVVYFGEPWWEGMPGTFRFSEEMRLEDITNSGSPSPVEISRFIAEKVHREMLPGVPYGSAQIDTAKGLPKDLAEAEVRSLVATIYRMLN